MACYLYGILPSISSEIKMLCTETVILLVKLLLARTLFPSRTFSTEAGAGRPRSWTRLPPRPQPPPRSDRRSGGGAAGWSARSRSEGGEGRGAGGEAHLDHAAGFGGPHRHSVHRAASGTPYTVHRAAGPACGTGGAGSGEESAGTSISAAPLTHASNTITRHSSVRGRGGAGRLGEGHPAGLCSSHRHQTHHPTQLYQRAGRGGEREGEARGGSPRRRLRSHRHQTHHQTQLHQRMERGGSGRGGAGRVTPPSSAVHTATRHITRHNSIRGWRGTGSVRGGAGRVISITPPVSAVRTATPYTVQRPAEWKETWGRGGGEDERPAGGEGGAGVTDTDTEKHYICYSRVVRFCTFCFGCKRGVAQKLSLDTLITVSTKNQIFRKKS